MRSTPAHQLEQLEGMTRGHRLAGLQTALVLLVAGLLAAGWVTGFPPCYLSALLLAVVAGSLGQSTPHLRQATEAYRRGAGHAGSVVIAITRGSDAESFRATVHDPRTGCWTFEFVPLGWTPREGRFAAQLYRLDTVPWPALAVLRDGILVPRQSPVRVVTPT